MCMEKIYVISNQGWKSYLSKDRGCGDGMIMIKIQKHELETYFLNDETYKLKESTAELDTFWHMTHSDTWHMSPDVKRSMFTTEPLCTHELWQVIGNYIPVLRYHLSFKFGCTLLPHSFNPICADAGYRVYKIVRKIVRNLPYCVNQVVVCCCKLPTYLTKLSYLPNPLFDYR